MPHMRIEALFRQFRKARKLSNEVGEVIPNTTLCRADYNNLHTTGPFSQSCYECRILQPDFSKTWPQRIKKKPSCTTQIAGYYSAVNTTNISSDNTTVGTMNNTTFGSISTLTEIIAEQTLVNSRNF